MSDAKYLGLTANKIAKIATNLERENAKLREYVTKLEMANLDVTARLTDYIGQYDPTDAFIAEVKTENANLRERITTQKQTIQAYRDESREWREVAERAQAENAKLRELVKLAYAFLAWADGASFSDGTPAVHESDRREVEDRMRELGVEVDG